MQLTKNFHSTEVDCPCCGKFPMQKEFMDLLQYYREAIGIPVKVNSGYRCAKYNERIGGAKASMHLKGQAVDIAWEHLDGATKHYMLVQAIRIFPGIGLHKSFLHVDNRTKETIWFY